MIENKMSNAKIGRIERLKRRIKVYTDLLDYWTQPRQIMSSSRLNQNQEFIDSQIVNAKTALAEFNSELVKEEN